jgi:hypothetical protein
MDSHETARKFGRHQSDTSLVPPRMGGDWIWWRRVKSIDSTIVVWLPLLLFLSSFTDYDNRELVCVSSLSRSVLHVPL